MKLKESFNYAMPGYWEWIVKTPLVKAVLNEAIRRQTIRDIYFYDWLIVPGIFNWQTRDLHLARKSNQCFAWTLGTIAHEVYHSLQDCPATLEDVLNMEKEAYLVSDWVQAQVPSKLFKGGAKVELKAARKHRKNFKQYGPQWSYDWAEYCFLKSELDKAEHPTFLKEAENPPTPFHRFSWSQAELI